MSSKKSTRKGPLAPEAAKDITTNPVVPEPETEEYELARVNVGDALKVIDGTLVAPVITGPVISVKDLVGMMPFEIVEAGTKGRGMILGVNTVMVLKSFCTYLVASRIEGNPAPLVYCGVIAVAVAYTVSRDWVEEYAEIPSPHMFTSFEIANRKAIKATADKLAIDWVVRSNMNAAALRIFGSMIVEAGQASSFLKHVKDTAGTIYNPIEGTKERDVIMKEASANVSSTDQEALAGFKRLFAKYAEVVGTLFGGGEADFVPYLKAAEALAEVTI